MVNSGPQEKSNLIIPLAIVIALIPIAGGLWWYLERAPAEPQRPGITTEGKAYVANLKLSGVAMKATANYVGVAVVEITGNIANTGTRPLSAVELTCVFYDVNGQTVLRERAAIVKSTLKPGENKSFRLAFEDIPEAWNRVMPQLVIAHLAFAG
ncbi:MAG TPA: FxLYD domain-containing protein [Bryobacteraceae bacterium]|nr:FxLYD domain-containing protein [Bryobacteraceae bacterium]